MNTTLNYLQSPVINDRTAAVTEDATVTHRGVPPPGLRIGLPCVDTRLKCLATGGLPESVFRWRSVAAKLARARHASLIGMIRTAERVLPELFFSV